MNFTLKSLLVLSALVSLNTYAHDRGCQARLRLSPEQRQELKSLNIEAKSKMKELRPELRKAKQALKKLLKSETATKEEALAVTQVVMEKQGQLKALKGQKELALLFDVLSAEQRVKLEKCEARRQRKGKLERERGHSRSPRIGHHRGPRHPHHPRQHARRPGV